MILIADSGSTKTSWTLVKDDGSQRVFYTEGYNPFYASEAYIVNSLKKHLPVDFSLIDISQIYFYGAGVHNAEKAAIIKNAFKQVFHKGNTEVEHDLLAAARALLSHNEGFAAILGTGTNTCIYNGKDIILQIESAGYILGDEGSGCYIGLQILKDYIRDVMPTELSAIFDQEYQTDVSTILDKIYTQAFANRYAADFSKFAGKYIQHPYCENLIRNAFEAFFTQLVSAYPNYKNYTFNCIGSIGFTFKDILTETAHSFGMQTGQILSSPMEGLVNYHLTTLKSI